SRAPLIIGAVLLAGGGLAFGGWQLYQSRQVASPTQPADAPAAATPTTVGAVADPTPDPTGDPTPDRAPVDAAEVVAIAATDAGPAPTDAPAAVAVAGDTLTIASTPPGARVYVDGADTGVTPLELPASPDRHTIALLLPGHELY